jgi:hypothetical protein
MTPQWADGPYQLISTKAFSQNVSHPNNVPSPQTYL